MERRTRRSPGGVYNPLLTFLGINAANTSTTSAVRAQPRDFHTGSLRMTVNS